MGSITLQWRYPILGPTRGVGRGTMTLGPINFRGPSMGPVGFRGPSMGPVDFRGPSRGLMGFREPIEVTLRNQHVKNKNLFFFLMSNQNPEKTVAFFLKDLFFGDHIKIRTQLWHFIRLFWSSQNRKSVSWPRTYVWLSAPFPYNGILLEVVFN